MISDGVILGAPILLLLLFGLLGFVGGFQALVAVRHALLPDIINKSLECFLLLFVLGNLHNHLPPASGYGFHVR